MSTGEHLTALDAGRSTRGIAEQTSENFQISRTPVDAGSQFDAHLHQEDQLAWMRTGSVELRVPGGRSRLRREHFAWIPAGMLHEMIFDEPGELISLYTDRRLRPPGDWDTSRVMQVDDLAGALLLHLAEAPPRTARRAQCRELLTDLFAESPQHHGVIEVPQDARARSVATALLQNPADPRELRDWAAGLGVSSKTLARAFSADTGRTFREWRILVRLDAAAGMLSRGDAVQRVAVEVGYTTASSFIAAFRQHFGVTPARYAGAL